MQVIDGNDDISLDANKNLENHVRENRVPNNLNNDRLINDNHGAADQPVDESYPRPGVGNQRSLSGRVIKLPDKFKDYQMY